MRYTLRAVCVIVAALMITITFQPAVSGYTDMRARTQYDGVPERIEKMGSLINQLRSVTTDRTDSDADGLEDIIEIIAGTDPTCNDTDMDGVPDAREIALSTDPACADSNNDGCPDRWEVSAPSLDTDGDGVPNAWDSDNDNDGVVDGQDLSMFSCTSSQDTFHIGVNGTGMPMSIDIQVRPGNAESMSLFYQVWDWPDDNRSMMKDLDHSTSDVTAMPFLEIKGSPIFNQSQVADYGMIVADNETMYLPLMPVWDGGQIVAFRGMLASPGTINGTVVKSLSYDLKLIWRIQGMTDDYRRAVRVVGEKAYMSLKPDGSIGLNNSIGTTEALVWYELEGKQVAMKAGNGKFLKVTADGVLRAIADSIDEDTIFEIFQIPTGGYAIKCSRGYITAGSDGNLGAPPEAALTEVPVLMLIELPCLITPITLSTYYQQFALTGLVAEENHGSEAATVYGSRVQDVIAADLFMDMEYLRNAANNLTEILWILESMFQLHASYGEYQSKELAVRALTGPLLQNAAAYMVSGEMRPVISILDDWYTTRDFSDLFDECTISELPLIDLGGAPLINTRIMKTTWYEGNLTNQLDVASVLENASTWTLDPESKRAALALIGSWALGESTNMRVGREVTQFVRPHISDMTTVIFDVSIVGISGIGKVVTIARFGPALNYVTVPLATFGRTLAQGWSTGFAAAFSKWSDTSAEIAKSSVKIVSTLARASFVLSMVGYALEFGLTIYTIWAICHTMGGGVITAAVAGIYATISLISLALHIFLTVEAYMTVGLTSYIFAAIAIIWVAVDLILVYIFKKESTIGMLIDWFVSVFTKAEKLTALDMRYIRGDVSIIDPGGNGLNVGDGINYTGWFDSTVTRLKDGTEAEMDLSSLQPLYIIKVPDFSETIVIPYFYEQSTSRINDTAHTTWNSGGIVAFGTAMPNFPVKISLLMDYQYAYEECAFGYCDVGYDQGVKIIPWETVYFDVMPEDIDHFAAWTCIVSNDSDGDGLKNVDEVRTDPHLWDTDGDGLGDRFELDIGTDPANADTDADGLSDGLEHDLGFDPKNEDGDNDGITDYLEYTGWTVGFIYQGTAFYCHVTSDPMLPDTDQDGVADADEYACALNPRSVDTDGDGVRDRVHQYYATDVQYLASFGGRSDKLCSVDLDKHGTVYAGYEGLEAYYKFDAIGAALGTVTSQSTFISPWFGTAISALDLIYNPDSAYFIQEMDLNGHVTRAAHIDYMAAAQAYAMPSDLADWGSSLVVLFDNQYFGVPSGHDSVWIYDYYGICRGHFGSFGSGPGQFIGALGVTVTDYGEIYVADTGNDRIQVFYGNGTFKTMWGSHGSGVGQFISPQKVAIADDGDILVADTGNNRVQVFDRDGRFVTEIGNREGSQGKLTSPVDLDIGPGGLLYVADNSSIKVFRLNERLVPPTNAFTLEDADGDGLGIDEENAGWQVTVRLQSSVGVPSTHTYWVHCNPEAADSDLDGLTDVQERVLGTDPRSADTDADGSWDMFEVRLGTNPTDCDSDGDLLMDGQEVGLGSDPKSSDTDGDRLSDLIEKILGTSPLLADTDNDGASDLLELATGTNAIDPDSDHDGLFDGAERQNGTDPLRADTDGDGIDDVEELAVGSDPAKADSDGDSLGDGYELDALLDPLAVDTDRDGLDDGTELARGLDGRAVDTDDDGVPDALDLDYQVQMTGPIVICGESISAEVRRLASELAKYCEVIVTNASMLLSSYSDSRWIVIVGDPSSGPGTSGALISQIMSDSPAALENLRGSAGHIAVRFGTWAPEQTVVMLSSVLEHDALRVAGVLRSVTVTLGDGSVLVDYQNPRACFRLDFEDSIGRADGYVWAWLNSMASLRVSMTRIDALNASVPLTHESGLLGPERALGRYLDVSAKLGDGSDAAGLITDAWVRIYYDQAELDLNHDGDCIDPGDVNESSLCLYWLSESGAWLKVGATNGEEIGVEMQDTSAAGKGYGGFAWANVSHLSLFALAGTLNSIPKAPSAPRDLAIEVRGARATISWNPPSDDGGDGIVSYAIYRNGSLLANTSSPGFIDDSIQEGASYAYQVRAYNHVGQGAASEATVNVPVSSSHMAMALLIIVGVSLIGIISFLTVNRRRP